MNTRSLTAQRQIRRHFDQFAPDYHRAAFDGAGMATLSTRDKHVVERACSEARIGTACDVGVGSARIATLLLERGFRVVGVDASGGMLAEARDRLGASADLLQSSLSEGVPLRSATCELVTCLRVLKYLPGWGDAVGELARVAAPGGIVCFDLANRRSVARLGYPAGMVWSTTLGHAAEVIDAAGLELLEVVAGVHLPDPLWRAARAERSAAVLDGVESVISSLAGNTGARSWTFLTRRRRGAFAPQGIAQGRRRTDR